MVCSQQLFKTSLALVLAPSFVFSIPASRSFASFEMLGPNLYFPC